MGCERSIERSPPAAKVWSPMKGLNQVREAFEGNCGSPVDAEAFMEGLRNGMVLIADRFEDASLQASLDDIVAKMRSTFHRATVTVGLEDVEVMKDFTTAVAAVITQSRIAA